MSSCGGGGCGDGGCQSSRLSPEEEEHDSEEARKTISPFTDPSASGPGGEAVCSKCGLEEQACNRLCAGCFRSHLLGKFKVAVTSNAMILPTDRVLIAFSGGGASRVALQFVHEMQFKALKNWDASKSQALPVFDVGVAFIDESALYLNPSCEIGISTMEIRTMLSDLGPPHKELYITPIESIYSLAPSEGLSSLPELLGIITDVTGREDFLRHLRMLALQKVALENKYTKIVLGSCTSAIARHVLSATVKGQGYALPADVQYVDARWEIPVVLPLRDCLEQDLNMICRLDSLKTWQLLSRPAAGINALVSSFVTHLLDENPSREHTIIRTAGKLKPFTFNKLKEEHYQEFLPSRLRPKFHSVKYEESTTSEILCPICGSPLSRSDQPTENMHGKLQKRVETFVSHCCQSCTFQILPRDEMSLERFYSVLPQLVTERVTYDRQASHDLLRDQIKDCLLTDDDDGP